MKSVTIVLVDYDEGTGQIKRLPSPGFGKYLQKVLASLIFQKYSRDMKTSFLSHILNL